MRQDAGAGIGGEDREACAGAEGGRGVALYKTGAGAVLEAEFKEQTRVYKRQVERLREQLRWMEAEMEDLSEGRRKGEREIAER